MHLLSGGVCRDDNRMQARKLQFVRQEILGAAEASTFDVHRCELRGPSWAHVDREAAFIVALVRRVERKEGTEISQDLARGGDHDDCKGFKHRGLPRRPQVVIDAIEANDPDWTDLHHGRTRVFRRLLKIAALSRGIAPVVERGQIGDWFFAAGMRGIEPQFETLCNRALRIGPRFDGACRRRPTDDRARKTGRSSRALPLSA